MFFVDFLRVKKNYFKRKTKLFLRLFFLKPISLGKFESVIVLFGLKIVHIGITDQLKGLLSAYYFSKLRGIKFFVKDDKNNTLSKMGIKNSFLLNEERDFFNPISDKIYLNYNHKLKIRDEVGKLSRVTSRVFWFSNNNILQSFKESGWEDDWNLLFNELFNVPDCANLKYKVGVHVRSGGFFGDFSDSFKPDETDMNYVVELITKIRKYIESLNLLRSEIYFCSDSVFLCLRLADIATINSSCKIASTNTHSAIGNNEDIDILVDDWKSMIGCERIVSISHKNFYNGVFPLYVSLVNNVHFEKVIIT